MANAVRREYGNAVAMEYIDLAHPAVREQHPDILQLAKDRYMRFPLVMVDGEIISHGGLDYYSLSSLINKRLTALQGKPQGKAS